MTEPSRTQVLKRLTTLRQHERRGVRSPHKPLLVLLALGRLSTMGSSAMPWSWAETHLGGLIADFGPPSLTNRSQAAAYPFTHLRADLVWSLDREVPMDRVTPLRDQDVIGRLEASIEAALLADPSLLNEAARTLVEAEFPPSLIPDVLTAAGLEPEDVFGSPVLSRNPDRRRSTRWPELILKAWDRQCAFCGFDGQLAGTPVGVEAAHVRWFNFDGPDELDNGLALCSLHHKLFDRGVVGLTVEHRIQVSQLYSARTDAGRLIYQLHGRELSPRPGTRLPSVSHLAWHGSQVFKGEPLAA